MGRRLVAAIAAVIAAACTALAAGQKAPQCELLRDRWGTACIFAAREVEGFYGLGYASAEDRTLQMDLLRRRGAGRLSEVFGQRTLQTDRAPWREPRSWVRAYTNKPIAICETGYTTKDIKLPEYGLDMTGDPATQAAYV